MSALKSIAKNLLPRRVRDFLRYVASPDYRDRVFWEADRKRGETVFARTGGQVVAGPFKGLKYVPTARGSSIGPKLLGTYELELRDVVEGVIARAYPLIINIGAGEGYYAIGLAQRMPETRFLCFDADPSNQEQIQTLARINGVARQVEIKGFCDDKALAQTIGDSPPGRVLVICDIEGAEIEVLNPQAVPALKNADLLVEMHDIIRKGCSSALRTRFESTHDIEVIPTRKRKAADFPAAVQLDSRQQLECMDEGRGAVMTFFWMRLKSAK
jgi:hypothetical protein